MEFAKDFDESTSLSNFWPFFFLHKCRCVWGWPINMAFLVAISATLQSPSSPFDGFSWNLPPNFTNTTRVNKVLKPSYTTENPFFVLNIDFHPFFAHNRGKHWSCTWILLPPSLKFLKSLINLSLLWQFNSRTNADFRALNKWC